MAFANTEIQTPIILIHEKLSSQYGKILNSYRDSVYKKN